MNAVAYWEFFPAKFHEECLGNQGFLIGSVMALPIDQIKGVSVPVESITRVCPKSLQVAASVYRIAYIASDGDTLNVESHAGGGVKRNDGLSAWMLL